MKNFTFYIFTFFTTLVFAQKPTELNWNYNDFINNDVNKVSKYSIPLRKNGKVKKRDSTLLFAKQIDLKNKTVFGIESSLVVVTHVGTHLTWIKFKDYYTDNGLILKETNSPLEIEKTKEFGFIVDIPVMLTPHSGHIDPSIFLGQKDKNVTNLQFFS